MGRVKAWMQELDERGYGESDKSICADCVSDPFLAQWIDQNLHATKCDFCGSEAEDPIAASFEDFSGIAVAGLAFDWNAPVHEGIQYISAEGGWMAELSDTWTVLEDAEISENWDVISELSEIIECEEWVPRDLYWGTEREHLMWGWEAFKTHTKHNTRYFFQQDSTDDDNGTISPAKMMDSISHIIQSKLSDSGIIVPINTDTDIIRIRVDKEAHSSAANLGTPKAEYAKQSNRMSPAGVPMFYGAFDQHTAIAETFDPSVLLGTRMFKNHHKNSSLCLPARGGPSRGSPLGPPFICETMFRYVQR